MPKVSEFFGIAIYVYWRDHGPPHFHAVYGEYDAVISIHGLAVLRGRLPPRPMGLVMEWATLRQSELESVWKQAENFDPLSPIEPL